MVDAKSNVTVIGGGPAGYVAAIRASQLGSQVTLVEKDTLGGTCINRGCIPTKVLLHSAEVLTMIKGAKHFGISADKVNFDIAAITKRKEAVVKQLVSGITSLMRKNKVNVVKGTGVISAPNSVEVVETREEIKSDAIIIATGSKPSKLAVEGIDGLGILDTDAFLNMDRLPGSAIVIGGGVIGLEYGQILHSMGVKVTIIEIMPHILPNEDEEVSNILYELMKQSGIEMLTGTAVKQIADNSKGNKIVLLETKEGTTSRKTADSVIVAVGRQMSIDNLGLEKLKITMNTNGIAINEQMETSTSKIYAAGDVTGRYMLAHVAMHEGKCAAENALGFESRVNYSAVPRCVYVFPEMASVGLTEEAAKKRYGKVQIGRFPFRANGRAMTLKQTEGMIKIIGDAKYGQVLGVHIVGSQATELIAQAVLGMQFELTVDDLASAMQAHPTLSEILPEAALDIEKKAIHI